MKSILALLVTAALLLPASRGFSAETNKVTVELQALTEKIKAKLQEGKTTEKELAEELKGFDTIIANHKGESADDLAQVLLLKASLYLQVFDNTEKGKEIINQVKKDFPDSKGAKMADQILASLKKQEEAEKLRATLVPGAAFPDFDEKDLDGKPLSLASHKGKVVLVDFWATWCGPCVRELPSVIQTYEKYHDKGFDIIGISLDDDRDKLTAFLKQKKMTWPQYFDGEGWGNKLAVKYGVNSIPATYLVDGQGKIIASDLRGAELEKAVAKALGGK
jgi:thiol-disulfide isomerase/thioredoxin